MTAVARDLYVEQGADFFLTFQWLRESETTPGTPGDPRDLTGHEVRMQIRRSPKSSGVLVDANSTNGKIVVGFDPSGPPDPANGRIRIHLTSQDTDLLDVEQAAYDLEVESPSGVVTRLLTGAVEVSLNVTRDAP